MEIYFKQEKYSASDGILRPHWVYDLEMKQGGLLQTWLGTQAIKLVFLWLTTGRGNGQVKMNSVMLYFAVCTLTIFFLGGSWWYCQQMRTIILSWERVQLTAFPWNMLQDFFQCWVEHLSRVDYAWAMKTAGYWGSDLTPIIYSRLRWSARTALIITRIISTSTVTGTLYLTILSKVIFSCSRSFSDGFPFLSCDTNVQKV